MARDFEDYYRDQEAANPMTKKEKAQDIANREYEKRMLDEESKRLKEESKPEFKARVERAIRDRGPISGGGSGAGVDIEGLPKKLKPGPKNMKKGGMVGSASKRADGCATKGKTRGKMV